MSLSDRLKSLFNRDVVYIDEYVDLSEDEGFDEADISDEEREVIALFVAAYAAEEKMESHFKIKSIKRIG